MTSRHLGEAMWAAMPVDEAMQAVNMLDAMRGAYAATPIEWKLEQLRSATQPLDQLLALNMLEQVPVKPGEQLARSLVETKQPLLTQPGVSLVEAQRFPLQQFTSTVVEAQHAQYYVIPTPVSQVAEQIGSSLMANVPSIMSSLADQTSWMSATAVHDWKPVLMRFSPLTEAAFASSLQELDRTLYFTVRPEITSLAEQLRLTFEFPLQDVLVNWMGRTYEFDFNLYPEIDSKVLHPDESSAAPSKLRKWPEFRSPLDIDTTVRKQPLIVKRLLVQLANNKWMVILIVGPTVVGGVGGAIGGPIGGAISSGLSAAISVVVNHYRNPDPKP